MNAPRTRDGFTLIELLTVIAIIAVLMGLLFSAIGGVKDSGAKTKAKNDLLQIVTAVKAYQTEYGKYPVKEGSTADDTYSGDNDRLFNILRATATEGYDLEMNPRKIAFIEIPTAKNIAAPKSGLGGDGKFYDPWGMPYSITIDSDYNNKIDANPYTNAGFTSIDTGVIAYSSGKNRKKDADAKGAGFDDILSWQ